MQHQVYMYILLIQATEQLAAILDVFGFALHTCCSSKVLLGVVEI